MTWLWAVFTFINLWWVMIFVIVSMGNTNKRDITKLDYAGAPDRTHFKKKFILAAIMSATATGIIALLMEAKIIDFTAI